MINHNGNDDARGQNPDKGSKVQKHKKNHSPKYRSLDQQHVPYKKIQSGGF